MAKKASDYWVKWGTRNPDLVEKIDTSKPGWKAYARKLEAERHNEMQAYMTKRIAEALEKRMEQIRQQQAEEAKAPEAEVPAT